MRNIKLIIEYDGTRYQGWQVQKRHPSKTLQETIEQALQKILQEKIRLVGSGRTDAGVHALAQVAHFRAISGISLEKLHRALNGLLPGDISILGVEECDIHFHSRFDAKSKVYRYTILNRRSRSPLQRDTVYFYPYPLNLRRMRKEAAALLGRHDFKSFQAMDKKERSSIRTIKQVEIIKVGPLVQIDIEADGFLHHMVRNIVGTLIEIGRGRFPEGSMRHILRSKDRKQAGPTVPGKGLCLLEVKY
ncbi:MAG: tRNA pseudouridine(38-40) synthase TruA [Candidatus Omnitrophota bacterium]